MNSLKQNDLVRARKICNLFRFMDYINVTNDRVEVNLKTILRLFIMKSAKLNKENSTNFEASFLDSN